MPRKPRPASDALRTAGRVIKRALTKGEVWTPASKSDMRLSTCRSCDRFDARTQTCRECRCNMGVKVKFEEARCPLGLW